MAAYKTEGSCVYNRGDMVTKKREHKWRALGDELKNLRKHRGISEAEMLERSGVWMGDRTLRSYLSGERRPPRDRLLTLVISACEMRSVATINRYLQLAKYADLTVSEIAEYKLFNQPATTGIISPAGYSLEVSTLIVTDAQGREVWRHQFPSRIAKGWYEGLSSVRRCTFGDIDQDGGVETLFVYVPLDFGSVGTTLYCFDKDGTIKWEFVPGRTIRIGDREYLPPYFTSNVQIIPIGKESPRILVSSNHYAHNPNQIAMLDATGKLISEYWHAGHLLSIAHADLNDDGVDELLLGGVNNGYGQATMIIFDPRRVSGASRQPQRQILGLPSGTEKAVVLFPKSCLSHNAPYNRVFELRVTRERRIMVAVVEGVAEDDNPGEMIYEFDFKLTVISARPDSHLQEHHRVLEEKGTVDHSLIDQEIANLRDEVVIKGHV